MISRKTLFSSLVLLLGCYFFMACTDDWATGDQGDSGGNVAIRLSVPLSKEDAAGVETRIDNMHLFAFSRGGDLLRYQQLKADFTNQQVLLPIGNCDLYLVANYPGATPDLNTVTSVADLEELLFSQEKIITSPFVMCGIYKGVLINNKAQIMYGSKDISKELSVERLTAKFTLDLKFTPKPGEYGLSIDSVRLDNQAGYSWLISQSYKDNPDYPLATAKKEETMENDSAHYEFYLPEYIITDATKGQSTYATIYTHVKDNVETKKEYKIYVGDWFGYSKKYNDFEWDKNKDNPADVSVKGHPDSKIGIDGLSVTRNKHYMFKGSIDGTGLASGMRGEVSIKDWSVTKVDMDIFGTPELSLSETEVMVNVLSPTSITYKTNMDTLKVESIKVDQPGFEQGVEPYNGSLDRFTAEVTATSIIFTHNPTVKRYTLDGTNPVTATGRIKVISKSGKVSLTKDIKLVSFLPISKVFSSSPALSWRLAVGYQEKYTIDYRDLKGEKPDHTYMNNAPTDASSGCASYFEGAENDYFLGKGNWGLPNKDEAARMVDVFKHIDSVEGIVGGGGRSFWTRDDVANRGALAYAAIVETPDYPQSKYSIFPADKQIINVYVRCIRSTSPKRLENATYLKVSHDYYDLSFGSPHIYGIYGDRLVSPLPIYYQSDVPVEYAIYDSDGNEVGNRETLSPYFFVFDTKKQDEALVAYPHVLGSGNGNMGMPSYYTHRQFAGFIRDKDIGHVEYLYGLNGGVKSPEFHSEGYLYIFPNLMSRKDFTSSYDQGYYPAQYDRLLYNLNGKRDFILVLRAGNSFSKSIRLRFEQMIASKDVEDGKEMLYLDAMGVSREYVGYNLSTQTIINTPVDLLTTPVAGTLVSDVPSGCSEYFEGSPSDPYTGKGCWYLSWMFPFQLMDYVADRVISNTMKTNGIIGLGDATMDGQYPGKNDQAYWDKYVGLGINVSTEYWTTHAVEQSGDNFNKQRVLSVEITNSDKLERYLGNPVDKTSYKASARCVRRVNADVLNLSDRSLTLSTSDAAARKSRKVTFYTSSPGGIDIQQLSYNKSLPDPFDLKYDKGSTSGTITITPNSHANSSSHVNLLVSSVRSGSLEKMKTYRIIKVQVK